VPRVRIHLGRPRRTREDRTCSRCALVMRTVALSLRDRKAALA
jgi:hypothetical protein